MNTRNSTLHTSSHPHHHPHPHPHLGFKGTISDHQFQTSLFFQTPRFFLHIQRELHCSSLPIQQPARFGKRDNSLMLGITYRRR